MDTAVASMQRQHGTAVIDRITAKARGVCDQVVGAMPLVDAFELAPDLPDTALVALSTVLGGTLVNGIVAKKPEAAEQVRLAARKAGARVTILCPERLVPPTTPGVTALWRGRTPAIYRHGKRSVERGWRSKGVGKLAGAPTTLNQGTSLPLFRHADTVSSLRRTRTASQRS